MKDMLLIYNARLVDRDRDIKNGALLIQGTKIAGFPTKQAVRRMLNDENVEKFDAGGKTLLPSFVDMHVHMRDPGQTQKEDLHSGCMAAAAGGFGTVVLMPNTNPVISGREMAVFNDRRGNDLGLCRVIQSVSITRDFDGKTLSHLNALDRKTVPLITEDGHEVSSAAVMLEAMEIAAQKNIIVGCHCEDPELAKKAGEMRREALLILNRKDAEKKDLAQAKKLLARAHQILAVAEDAATFRNIRLAAETGVHVHICHVSTERSMDAIRRAKAAGQDISCEVTPHHLSLSCQDGRNWTQIVNPPLRPQSDRLAVIQALMDGTADVIATDHAPHTMSDKASGSPGFSGLETAFASCYTTLCLENGMSLRQLSEKMSARPAELLGLRNTGLLEEGMDADVTIADTDKIWTVRGSKFASGGKYTALEGKKLTGQIAATFYNGKLVFQA